MPAPARRLESGTIWVDAVPADGSGRVVVYARVSSHDQRRDLDRQVARLTGWATGNGNARSYGQRGARSRAMRAVTAAGREAGGAGG